MVMTLGTGMGEGVVTHMPASRHSSSRPKVGQATRVTLHSTWPWKSDGERGCEKTNPRKGFLLVWAELATAAFVPPFLWASPRACLVL